MLYGCGLDRIQCKAKGVRTDSAPKRRRGFTCTIFCQSVPLFSVMFPHLTYIWNCQAFYLSVQHGNTEHQAQLYFLGCWRVPPLSTHLWTH